MGGAVNAVDGVVVSAGLDASGIDTGHVVATTDVAGILKRGDGGLDAGFDFGYTAVPPCHTGYLEG